MTPRKSLGQTMRSRSARRSSVGPRMFDRTNAGSRSSRVPPRRTSHRMPERQDRQVGHSADGSTSCPGRRLQVPASMRAQRGPLEARATRPWPCGSLLTPLVRATDPTTPTYLVRDADPYRGRRRTRQPGSLPTSPPGGHRASPEAGSRQRRLGGHGPPFRSRSGSTGKRMPRRPRAPSMSPRTMTDSRRGRPWCSRKRARAKSSVTLRG